MGIGDWGLGIGDWGLGLMAYADIARNNHYTPHSFLYLQNL